MARSQPQPKKKASHKASDDQQVERLHQGYAQSMEITKVLADEHSKFQHIRIFDTVANGRVMTLDDVVQITDRDESAYADMLTHLPMLEHGKVERVMIVGGGDLSIADEALKHKDVKEVVLVDIDERVIALCKKHFGAVNAKAFKDKRMTVHAADAFEFLARKECKNRFDLIIADRPDPIGPGKVLFGETFYDRIKGALKPGGYATFQTGVPFYQPWEVSEAIQELKQFFPKCGLYLSVVPTYIGGFVALTWASKGGKPLGTPAGIKKAAAAYKKIKLQCDYYNPAIHAAAFALPNWIAKAGSLIEKSALQLTVAVAGLVPVGAGMLGVLDPATLDISGGASAMTHTAYLSGLLLGIGLAFWSLIPAIERQGRVFALLTAIVFVGGLARLLAAIRLDAWTLSVALPLVMELAVTPLLWMWQRRVAKISSAPSGLRT